MLILDGKPVAAQLVAEVATSVQDFVRQFGRPPHLAVILVGDHEASKVYVRNKALACQKVGMRSSVITMPNDSQAQDVTALIQKLNSDDQTDGILLQLPLPSHLNSEALTNLISVEKDVDALTATSEALFNQEKSFVLPCTPQGILKILKYYSIPLQGLKTVVIGRSRIVGKPMAVLLQRLGAIVEVVHSQTMNPTEITSKADLVIVAAGKPRFFGKSYFKTGATVIDVGVHKLESGKLCGDVHREDVEEHLKALSPVPGGVGPMTIACLLKNTLSLARMRIKK